MTLSKTRAVQQNGEVAQKPDRRGIALILCIGILSVMMVLGVAFAISMRTERLAAGNHMEVARARQLVMAGLSHALWDINDDLKREGTRAYPVRWGIEKMPTNLLNAVNLYSFEATNLIRLGVLNTCALLASRGTNMGTAAGWMNDYNAQWGDDQLANPKTPGGAWVESGDRRGYVTDNSVNSIMARNESGGGNMPWSSWYRLRDPAIPQWWPVEGVGRYAYLVVNLSGLLDANRAGHDSGPGPRGPGTTLADIDLSRLPEFASGGASTFASDRTSNPYDTLYELKTENAAFVGTGREPRNLCAYSRAEGRIDGSVPATISGNDPSRWSARASVEAAFRAAASDQDASVLYGNLLDYVDADDRPQNVDGPYVEAVPMINEVHATNETRIAAPGGNTVMDISVHIEYFYPFAASNGPFRLTSTVPLPTNFPGFRVTQASPTTILRTQNFGPGEYHSVRHSVRLVGTNGWAGGQRTIDVIADVRDVPGGAVVDRMPTIVLNLDLPGAVVLPGGATVLRGSGNGHDVVDPRFNWNAAHWANGAPFGYQYSIGGMNSNTFLYLQANLGKCDGDTWMHVANEPLRSVGELGNLFAPGLRYARFMPTWTPLPSREAVFWTTLKLYDHGSGDWDEVYDYFAVGGYATTNAGTVSVFKGRVNPNTEATNVLASVFYRMPVNAYPDGPAMITNTWGQAMNVAEFMQDYSYTNQFIRLSDLGRREVFNGMMTAMQVPSSASSLEKESLYRNSMDLLHPRQNIFAILLTAQTAADPFRYGPKKAEQRALALVWRDPVADSDGEHPCFVRWFTWIRQ